MSPNPFFPLSTQPPNPIDLTLNGQPTLHITTSRSYTLTPSGPCHRTQVALRTQTLPSFFAWKKWIECLYDEDEEQEKLAGEYLARKILDAGLTKTNKALGGLLREERGEGEREEMVMLPEDIRRVLVKRWEQIRDMILGAYECTGCVPRGGVDLSAERPGGKGGEGEGDGEGEGGGCF